MVTTAHNLGPEVPNWFTSELPINIKLSSIYIIYWVDMYIISIIITSEFIRDSPSHFYRMNVDGTLRLDWEFKCLINGKFWVREGHFYSTRALAMNAYHQWTINRGEIKTRLKMKRCKQKYSLCSFFSFDFFPQSFFPPRSLLLLSPLSYADGECAFFSTSLTFH